MSEYSKKLVRGDTTFGLVPRTLGELGQGDFITFAYEAETPGTRKKVHGMENLYDANPYIYLLSAKRDTFTGNTLITGLNCNYLEFKRDKARIIASLRISGRMNTRFYRKAIHQYRLDRVKSKLFKAVDVFADVYLLKSTADWTKV